MMVFIVHSRLVVRNRLPHRVWVVLLENGNIIRRVLAGQHQQVPTLFSDDPSDTVIDIRMEVPVACRAVYASACAIRSRVEKQYMTSGARMLNQQGELSNGVIGELVDISELTPNHPDRDDYLAARAARALRDG